MKYILITVFIVSLILFMFAEFHHTSKPNNQYELIIYQDHIDLKDGKRIVVENISWDSVGELKRIIEQDNL
jgi:hypothetical protein